MPTLSWPDIYARLSFAPPGKLWGIPRGGQIVAGLTGRAVDTPDAADVIVDDICDSGATKARYEALYHKPVWALMTKAPTDGWIQLPWEATDATADLADTVRRQLEWLGEDPRRAGLLDTPGRVERMLREMTSGMTERPASILGTVFTEACDEMVVVRHIPYWSLCEHHLLPFHGTATVGYVPQGARIVGLSKIPRLVHCFAKRLQVQERLTQQIAAALDTHLVPLGVGVVLSGEHTCMQMRGIRSPGEMITSCLRGILREAAPRAEFLALAQH